MFKTRALVLSLLCCLLVSCGPENGDSSSIEENGPGNFSFISRVTLSRIELDDRSTSALVLSWDLNTAYEGYNLYRDGNLVATLGMLDNEFFDKNLTPNTGYNYQYSVVSGNEESALSPVFIAYTLPAASTLPAQPTNANHSSITGSSIKFSWADEAEDETSYSVRRISPEKTYELPFNTRYFVEDSGLESDTTYTYEITAINDAGASEKLVATFTTLHPAVSPAPPTSVVISNQTSTSLTVSFMDNANNEDGYLVSVVGTSDLTSYCQGINLTSCQITGLNPNTSYDLIVKTYTLTKIGGSVSFYISSSPVEVSGTTAM